MNGTQENLDHWKKFSGDLEPKGGILSRRKKGTEILRNHSRKVWKELCYGKAETLNDAEKGGEMVAI